MPGKRENPGRDCCRAAQAMAPDNASAVPLENLRESEGHARGSAGSADGAWMMRYSTCDALLTSCPRPSPSSITISDCEADMAHKYELVVAWSREDAAFVVDVPELPGCMAHGGTPAEAVANAQDAISLWLEAARDMGRPIPRPRGRRLMTA